jgi:hypothetical protein
MGELKFKLSRHAKEEMDRRSIPLRLLESVLERPQQIVSERGEKKAYQSQLDFGGGKTFLVRAIVDQAVDPPIVVTVYRTSKIAKYWRTV